MTTSNDPPTQAISNSIAGVRFLDVGKPYHFDASHLPDLLVGDFVIVETARGRQLGQVTNLLTSDEDDTKRDYKPILRKATPADMMNQKAWKGREPGALANCQDKAAELGGFENVKFIAAQFNYDGTLLTFLYSSEDKVNTGKLRTALQRSFRAKVELRQVGPRDVAKLLGGMGACGVQRCCSVFLTDFSPISIKMAKAQGISLNPSEITGMCGRLRCCLVYEYEQYVEARKHLPKRNKRVGTPHGEGRVIDVLPMQEAVIVMVEETRYTLAREELIPLEEYEAFKAKAQGDVMPVTPDESYDFGPDDEPSSYDSGDGGDDISALDDENSTDHASRPDTEPEVSRARSSRRRGKRRGRSRRRPSGQNRQDRTDS